MNFFNEEKIAGDAGEENILKNGVPAKRLYSDRTHTYTASSGRCWPDWMGKSSSTCMADAYCQDGEGFDLPPFRHSSATCFNLDGPSQFRDVSPNSALDRCIDDDVEGLSDDVVRKFRRRGA